MNKDDEKGRKRHGQFKAHEVFVRFAFELLGGDQAGSVKDEFGGELLYVYRKKAALPGHHISRNLNLYFSGDEQTINEMLPQAAETFRKGLLNKISEAMHELTQEVLDPIYKATNIKWQGVGVKIEPGSDLPTEYYIEEIKKGRISRRVTKTLGPGRPPEWSTHKLERELLSAAKKVNRRKEKLALSNVVKVMNERRKGKTPLSENAWKKLFGHYGIEWKRIKGAFNSK